MFGGVAFFLKFWEEEAFLGLFGRFPAGQSVGEEDADALVAFFGEGSAKVLEKKAKLEMGDDEGSRENFEAEDAIFGGFFQIGGDEGIAATLFESFVDAIENFDEIRAGAAAGIEHVDIFVGETVGKIEFFAEDGVHASDHIFDNFRRGVPDAEILAEFRVEGLEERFVKILDSVGLLEFCEKGGTVDAVENARSPVEDFSKI